MDRLKNSKGVIRRYQKEPNNRKSKDRQCNVQKFGKVKGEIDPAKTNREHKIQWPKEKKQTMIFRALHKKLNIEHRKTGDKLNQTYVTC